ncbi:hypothetical protein GCM10009675_50320 [Prauserella alba]|uniref:Uncharacterized protein n=1 Tax=Prauserella alba TaxID=176898 RepID=A0ABP4GDF7_9PSEU
MCVVRPAGLAVPVEIEPGGNTGVDRGGVGVRVLDRRGAALADLEVVVAERVGRRAALDVVELVQKQHVGPVALDDLGDLPRLLVVSGGQVAQQLALGGAVQRRVERREPHVVRTTPARTRGCCGRQRRHHQPGRRGHTGEP